MRRPSSIFIRTPRTPTTDLTTLTLKTGFFWKRIPGRPRPHRRCWPSRPDLGERWPARLVATAAAEDRLTFPARYGRAKSRHPRGDLIKYPKLPWSRLFALAALLVFGAVTLALWGFLAWLIWHVI